MIRDETATELLEDHEKKTGRCYTRACTHNPEEGCEKPVDKPCPQKWLLTGDIQAGVGEDLQRNWKEAEA